MVIPEEQDGKIEISENIANQIEINNEEVNTRKNFFTQQKILVDMREFRAKLPSSLNRNNFEIIPMTLTIGDYILTPDICVERKSVPDLFQSFSSGRLFQQTENMCRTFNHAILLIEFEENQPFYLQPTSQMSDNQIQMSNIITKLSILTKKNFQN